MTVATAQHDRLWERILAALAARQALLTGNVTPLEIARFADTKLETDGDPAAAFVEGYYLERRYGGSSSRLSQAEAEGLVIRIEALSLVSSSKPASALASCPDNPPSASTEPGLAFEVVVSVAPLVEPVVAESEAWGSEYLTRSQPSPGLAAGRPIRTEEAERQRLEEDTRKGEEERKRLEQEDEERKHQKVEAKRKEAETYEHYKGRAEKRNNRIENICALQQYLWRTWAALLFIWMIWHVALNGLIDGLVLLAGQWIFASAFLWVLQTRHLVGDVHSRGRFITKLAGMSTYGVGLVALCIVLSSVILLGGWSPTRSVSLSAAFEISAIIPSALFILSVTNAVLKYLNSKH